MNLSLTAVQTLSYMIILSCGVTGEETLKAITYVIPTTNISVSPCDHNIVTAHHYNCSKVTLNELINYGYEHFAVNGTDSHDIVLLSGTHLVNSTQTRNLSFFGKDVNHLRLIGDGNVHVIGVSFIFLDVEEINVSNIHFNNRNGLFDVYGSHGGYDNTLIFACSEYHECVVKVTKITITNDGGIAVIFKAHGENSFTLTNSRISTDSVGVSISTARHSPAKIMISSVSFYHSCFMINGGTANSADYHFLNVNFTGCSCSSVISVHAGDVQIIMNNVTINDTESRYLVYSDGTYFITLKGQCLFSNNRGIIIATRSQLLFLEAKIKFINNNIGKSFETLSAIIVAVSTRIIFDNSHVIFENNYGNNGSYSFIMKRIIRNTVNESLGMIAHQYCPFDYCRNDYESLLIRLEYQDKQCAFNRTGILCGGCQTNFSRVLGSSKCKKCSNIMLLAILPSVALAGLLLVIFLMVLNLTVSVGTINGLIFYANVIQIEHAIFFTSNSSNSFLSVFIAWLNLDFGIESCFYDGYDGYAEMWLQFCFLLYVWLIAIIIIISSHYSTRVSNLYSKNAVQVLATLFLLSYTKLIRLGIDVLTFTTITYPDGYVKTVWVYDGNVDFLKSKHIPLSLVTLLLLVLSVPYTLSLLGIQWLFNISHYRFMFWVQRLKPFFDAYTGPYKANHRYWMGLLLIVRILCCSYCRLSFEIL